MRFDCPASWQDSFQDEASVLTFQQPHSHLERRQLEKALRQEIGKLKRYQYDSVRAKNTKVRVVRIGWVEKRNPTKHKHLLGFVPQPNLQLFLTEPDWKRYYSTLSKKPASIYFTSVPVSTNQPRVGNAGTLAVGGRKNQAFLTDANKACRLHWDNFLKVFAYPFTGMITL
ncbi:hypothetical protein [Coleofasciculus sp. H7-2]|uniref:hypothetical protein n=1 Tax=Coleofasciculus sp. H7-2 TaxID=3351545 RepID=UPI00366FF716